MQNTSGGWLSSLSCIYDIFLRNKTALKESKYGVFSGPYFLVFHLNTGKYGPEKTPYLDTFRTVLAKSF